MRLVMIILVLLLAISLTGCAATPSTPPSLENSELQKQQGIAHQRRVYCDRVSQYNARKAALIALSITLPFVPVSGLCVGLSDYELDKYFNRIDVRARESP